MHDTRCRIDTRSKTRDIFIRHPVSCIVYFVSLFLFLPNPAYSEVIFYDAIALKNETVMLEARTKGKIFSRGGEVVEFLVGGESIGKVLSGGDGFAFKEFIAQKIGLYKIEAVAGKDKDKGTLLSLEKGAGIVFIDVEGSLHILSSKGPPEDSKKVIRAISRRFHVVYLQTFVVGVKAMKKWLKENGFVEAPVLSWKGGDVFQEISKKGLKIKLIIGRPDVIESAKEFKQRAFSFIEVEGAEEVKDWEEIGKKLGVMIK